ncbi:MAG: YicC family protein [Ruminococcus sp.]|nr:YicC family protein [Ruminococcus sp.]MBR6669130.1 YicC family protein [Ruminococcus sp.]
MIKSMTGYGRAQQIIDGRDILVEIRSVNHRYFEFSSRVPRAYGYLDEKLKSFLQGKVNRGKVEIAVTINIIEGKDALIKVNKSIAKGYIDALREVNEELQLRDDLSLSNLLRFPDTFNIQKNVDDEEEIWNAVSEVASEALEKFISMREAEGQRLKKDVLTRSGYILENVAKVEKLSPETVENYRNRLYQKLKEVLESTDIDTQRILTEAAIFADKIAVDEETVRLRSHVSQLEGLFDSDEAIGRKLDFIVQEMNREVNTIGSKCQDVNITKIVVEMKSEIEKIREQIQNIE